MSRSSNSRSAISPRKAPASTSGGAAEIERTALNAATALLTRSRTSLGEGSSSRLSQPVDRGTDRGDEISVFGWQVGRPPA